MMEGNRGRGLTCQPGFRTQKWPRGPLKLALNQRQKRRYLRLGFHRQDYNNRIEEVREL